MNKKKYILGLIIIIVFGMYFQVSFSGYYNTPEEALNHSKFNDESMESIIETVWVKEQPIIFYASNQGDFCEMEFNKKEMFGQTAWKSKGVGILETKTVTPNILVPTRMASGQRTDGKPKVLFGITKSTKAEAIKVNGEIPNFKNFQIKGEDYVLWYIITGTDELNIDEVKITSDSK